MSLTPNQPIPPMLEHELYAVEMEAEGFLTGHVLSPPVRLTILRMLMAYRQVKYGPPLIMPEDVEPSRADGCTFRTLSDAEREMRA